MVLSLAALHDPSTRFPQPPSIKGNRRDSLEGEMSRGEENASGSILPRDNLKIEPSPWKGTKRRRLLIVTPRYLPYMGGVEKHVFETASRLASAGFDVTVLTTAPGNTLPALEKIEGVNIHRVPAWPANRDYYIAPEIYKVITNGSWDLVHVQSYHTFVAPIAMAAALRANIPYLVTFHGGGHTSRLRNLVRGAQHIALRPLLLRAERLVAVARFEIDFFSARLRIPRKKFVLIPNGADLIRRESCAAPEKEGVLIASIGRLERYKGHHKIIAALPYVLEQQPDARLWIAGTGPYEKYLRDLAERLGLSERVDIRAIPISERARMAAEVSKADLVMLMSEYETHPIAVLEAAALGRPVLVADSPGLRELAAEGLARSIPIHSEPQTLASAILRILHEPFVPRAVQLPTWDDCARELSALYLECMRREICGS